MAIKGSLSIQLALENGQTVVRATVAMTDPDYTLFSNAQGHKYKVKWSQKDKTINKWFSAHSAKPTFTLGAVGQQFYPGVEYTFRASALTLRNKGFNPFPLSYFRRIDAETKLNIAYLSEEGDTETPHAPCPPRVRQAIACSNHDDIVLSESGDLFRAHWDTGAQAWTYDRIKVSGGAIVPGTLVSIGGGQAVCVNEHGEVGVTYQGAQGTYYAVIEEYGRVQPFSLRHSDQLAAVFAVDPRGRFVYLKWHDGGHHRHEIEHFGAPIAPETIELREPDHQAVALNTDGDLVRTYPHAGKPPAVDGQRFAYGINQNTGFKAVYR